ncbi:MAG: large conductance mechanosensitive channel protein MscL [Ilumatobacter sp.]|nr:large conductance mechanosensitive channel protein MscL [Ilumatobacter sp.]
MKKYLDEFKDFVNKGNLVALAIAFIMALFFAPIITALVDGVIMNLIAAIFGQPNFDAITIDVGDAELLVGTVITAIIQFLIVAFVCFLVVKAYENWKDEEEEDSGPSETDLLTQIRDLLQTR